MKFSEKWLRTWVNSDLNREQLCERLTLAGLEVDGIELVADEFSGVIVGEVVVCEKHPNADKLSCCKVDINGDELLSIVCGAKNVRVGIKVPVAIVGAVLKGGDFKIKKSKLRGELSQGMICSKAELGLAESSDGIMELDSQAPLGMDVCELLACDDVIIDIDLTPNRGDCLSIQGIARETAALTGATLEYPEMETVETSSDARFDVDVSAANACPRYLGRVIKNIDLNQPSPWWLQDLLSRSGIRSIDPVVDVTNFVMLELGQPMHAFDLAQIGQQINVRYAKENEKIILLNGEEKTLTPDTLVIADARRALAIAGVMGGENSGVSRKTQDIFLESAYFSANAIAGKTRQYNVFTDSAFRFERGVDFALQRKALERATMILQQLVGGEPGPIIEVTREEHLPQLPVITLNLAKVNQLLGINLTTADVNEALQKLQFKYEAANELWQITPPTWRYDIRIEEDIVEEIARIIGYEQIPAIMPNMPLVSNLQATLVDEQAILRQVLIEHGFSEVVTYSFVDHNVQDLFAFNEAAIALANPISSEMDVMRVSLWPGLLKTLLHNQTRGLKSARYFECGMCFSGNASKPQQSNRLAALMSGASAADQWAQKTIKCDFYDMKAVVEQLCARLQLSVNFIAAEVAGLHPGQTAQIKQGDRVIGCVGALHPRVAQNLKLSNVYLFELNLDKIAYDKNQSFKLLSKFPAVERDLSIVVAESVEAQSLLDAIANCAGYILEHAAVVDVYKSDSIGEGLKSISLRMIFRSAEETLQDEQVNCTMETIIKVLVDDFAAKIRD